MQRKILVIVMILTIFCLFNECAFIFQAPQPKTLKERALEQIWYFATEKERDELERLNNPEEINQFMEKFWMRLDSAPETDDNEVKSEIAKRYKFVMIHYPSRRGWGMSAQGRVYMLYGPPDQIDHCPFTPLDFSDFRLIKGIEIWVYDQPSGGIEFPNIFSDIYPNQMKFIFADLKGINIYDQIYSSEPGEIVNPRVLLTEF